MAEMILTGARVVGPDAVIEGTVVVRDGRIAEIAESTSRAGEDFGGDYLLPGLVELHTDNMERHFAPRPGVRWPGVSAVLAHDGQIAAAGITTVFDAVGMGTVRGEDDIRIAALDEMLTAVKTAREGDMFRAEHLFHLRCETSYPSVLDRIARLIDDPSVKLASVMDHTPGQRQFTREDKFREYYKGKFQFTDKELDTYIATQKERCERWSAPNRRGMVEMCRARDIPLASHDDATPEHVAEAVADGMVVAEFPTTVEAARLSREGGMKVVMGGPNLVRGGSHSGNISAGTLAAQGLLDIVSSDYVPVSLLESAFRLTHAVPGMDLPKAVRTVSQTPAEAVGLDDRGAIIEGRRADLVRVSVIEGQPVVRAVWREGRRIA